MRLIDADALKKFIGTYDGTTAQVEAVEVKYIDNAPTVEVPEEVNCVLTMFGKCSYNETGCSDCKIKDKIRKALKERPNGEWIPVSERRFPDDETEVLIQYGESMMVGYHIFDRTLYPFGYEDENETGWYDSKDNFICGSDEVIAWMPLPKPYEEADNE